CGEVKVEVLPLLYLPRDNPNNIAVGIHERSAAITWRGGVFGFCPGPGVLNTLRTTAQKEIVSSRQVRQMLCGGEHAIKAIARSLIVVGNEMKQYMSRYKIEGVCTRATI